MMSIEEQRLSLSFGPSYILANSKNGNIYIYGDKVRVAD
jgi:hypothetical protein